MSMRSRCRKHFIGWLERAIEFVHLDLDRLANKRLGILQYQTPLISGEEYFLTKVMPDLMASSSSRPLFLDAGANEGNYAAVVLKAFHDCDVHCFEPNPPTFARLAERFGRDARVRLNRVAVGEAAAVAEIFDYAEREGSSHASLYAEVLTTQHRAELLTRTAVPVIRLDDYIRENQLSEISLLKLDLEGHELAAIKGAEATIRERLVAVVHFEFNEMNVISRTFLRDFYTALPGYAFFRLRQDGLIPLGPYNARHEVFQYQNIVALRTDLDRSAIARHCVTSLW